MRVLLFMILFILLFFFSEEVGMQPSQKLRHGLFLVDSSAYRSNSEFAGQIDFIKSIAKRLNVSPTGTRAGVILYGDEPQLSVGLEQYKTLPEFYSLLDGLTFPRGGRALHKVNVKYTEKPFHGFKKGLIRPDANTHKQRLQFKHDNHDKNRVPD